MPINIAIDGPAGAGKSTVARQLAKEMGYIYVDTGAMYRAMALCALRAGIQPDDEAAVTEVCRKAEVSLEYRDGAQQILLNGENVTDLIRPRHRYLRASFCRFEGISDCFQPGTGRAQIQGAFGKGRRAQSGGD